MKRSIRNSIGVIFFITIMFSFFGCGIIDEAISECDAKENQISPTEKRTFVLGVKVKHLNGDPAVGARVEMVLKKEYCNGDIKGVTVINDPNKLTDNNGYWFSGWQQTYDYNNKKDRVLVEFATVLAPTEATVLTHVYRWEDVDEEIEEHVLGFVNKTFSITLPY